MRHLLPALLGALVFVSLMMVGGESSPVMLIGQSLAEATGPWWPYLAAYLGALVTIRRWVERRTPPTPDA